jgi:hypothetical protein
MILTQEYLKQIIRYDPDTGLFYWAKYRNWRTPVGKIAGGIGGKTRYLGCFKTQEEANAAYLDDARKLYGEFARS